MAFIKSALEIALERTKDVKSDPETVKMDSLLKDGRKFASEYLNNTSFKVSELGIKLKSFNGEEKKVFKEGLVKTFLSNINLPKNENYKEYLQKIDTGLSEIVSNKKSVAVTIEQIKHFYAQYLENRTQLIEALKQQYTPRLMQKQQELAQKYGHEVNISPEQDPEFMEIVKANLVKLETQYNDSLSRVKEELQNAL